MKDQLPEIELTTRVSFGGSGSTMVTRDNEVFELDDVAIADGNFLRVLDFPLIQGDPKTALQEPRTIVLSRSAAKKFFGRADPLGKILLLARFKLPCTVTGVMAGVVALAIALATISVQAIKAAVANPIDSLKAE